jgi:hypothetical protein
MASRGRKIQRSISSLNTAPVSAQMIPQFAA